MESSFSLAYSASSRFLRKPFHRIGGVFFFAACSWALVRNAPHQYLFFDEFANGQHVGMGIKISTIPIMTSECVPAIIRGGLVMSFQLWVAFGIFMYVHDSS